MKYDHLFGLTFGELTVVSRAGELDALLCKCTCGNEKIARACHLKGGTVKSCGCLLKRRPKEVHGTYLASRTLEYKTWDSMIRRCHQPNHYAYENYGGRGIHVCERWQGPMGFGNFLDDMGPKQRGTSLDRINNSLGYSPENCRWTDMRVQSNNRRGNVFFTSQGQTMTLSEWSRITGVDHNTMRERLKRGWSPEKAIHTPPRPLKPRS